MPSNEFKTLQQGMPMAVAERTILRKISDISRESWEDVAKRVALGNALLCPNPEDVETERAVLEAAIGKATLLFSGRHLQHGDKDQPKRPQEVFTNCSTAPTSFLLFYLLLNGSGVGRAYDNDLMMVDWDNAPNLRCVLSDTHPDFDWSRHESVRDARHKYGTGKNVMWHEVADSREGWAKALELWENAAFEKIHGDKLLVLDFSQVRPKGSPIGGMQNRPASGPRELMDAFEKSAKLKGAGLAPWKQAIYVDHYFAECVLVGGARRAARMATKTWRDKNVLDFVTVKRPLEYVGKTPEQIVEAQKAGKPQGFLWSSNNSVTVDAEFWSLANGGKGDADLRDHSKRIFEAACEASYYDGTGEPGFINVDRLTQKDDGYKDLLSGSYVGSKRFQVNEDTHLYLAKIARKARTKSYAMITNPCSEIALTVVGGFCVIADVVPYHADTLDEAESAFRIATRALIRVNLMDSIYAKEVKRTNRIGVGITGIHEFAWKFFQLGFHDLIDEKRSRSFWLTLARFNRAVTDEAERYSKQLGVTMPHTLTTIKPAGTTSKLFMLTEGWHLPSMREFLRWVQFRADDPLVRDYQKRGYPVRELKTYAGTTIVGFPTAPTITTLGMGDKLVTAAEATPEEQYQWLMLGEKYWIDGTDEAGKPLAGRWGNQISYTLKYFPDRVSYTSFREMMLRHQSRIKCCSVMPQTDSTAYEYQPEQPVTSAEYADLTAKVQRAAEDVDFAHVDCQNGACPVDFRK
jgi:adenosylcobalamin-dependent ribonucleoside-triphosphate reductase